ncbi:hypothetical protein Neosp_001313 [[Neocosmospora] mangrovei]
MQDDGRLQYEIFWAARDLAKMFEGMCPETPNFLSAYKQRFKEISGSTTRGFSYEYGLSIRSDLTRATDARYDQSHYRAIVHLHLLACIIASGSDAEEATTTWETLVTARRLAQTELRPDISRSRLATWDSGARAWIGMGNSCMPKKKRQLKSLLQHAEFGPWKISPIFGESYTATQRVTPLINLWLSALTTMENLASGQPQEVPDGEILRILAAWHMYPDVYVFGSRNLEAHMHDALVPRRGFLTVDFGRGAKAPSNEILRSLRLPDA